MKDMPAFTTEHGVASLILREIPYNQKAYIKIQYAAVLQDLMKECASFCRAIGAEEVYVSGDAALNCYPIYTELLEMQIQSKLLPETDAVAVALCENQLSYFKTVYNEKMNKIRVKKLRTNAILPTYGSVEAAGADLYACLDEAVTIEPGQTAWVPTGIAMEVPKGCAGLVYARSGMACKRGLAPANKVGVIDSDYRGEITVVLHNHGTVAQTVESGERIAQMVITPVLTPAYEEVEELSNTGRGQGGFGSTGQ